jgi:NAD(P)-dependent dehydrogenase (short-subunit alcohol dehydrogenase family)
MAERLEGKVALITGGARGQGAAEADLFAQEGARVLIGDIRDELGEKHAEALQKRGRKVLYTHLDVTDDGDWRRAVSNAESEFGRLDVLVNNAGVALFAGAVDATDEEWNHVIGVNQTGVFYGMRASIPALERAGGGSIINIASCFAVGAVPGYFAYQASKGAVRMMTKAAAVEYAEKKIRVNTILPGLIITPMTETEPAEAVEANIRETPLGRAGEEMEIAYGALYLASDESSYVTGTELTIDGGYLAH